MSFIHAVENTRNDKTQMFSGPNNEYMVMVKDEPITVRAFVFYKQTHGGILDDDNDDLTKIILPATVLKNCPNLKIPVPVIRRKILYDNRFFFASMIRIGNQRLSTGSTRAGNLYIPFLYCYFEESSHEEKEGYIIKTYPKYSSKLDRNLTFVDRDTFMDREDDVLKQEAIDYYIQIKELQREQIMLTEKLDKLDTLGRLQQEFAQMEQKLVQNGGD